MKRKVGTVLDDALLRRIRLESARRETPMSDLIAEAVEEYLDAKRSPRGIGSIVDETFGVIEIAPRAVARVLREEAGLFEDR